jgi:hypothetical protein
VLGLGFAAVAAWAMVDQYVLGHLASHVADYVEGGRHLLQGARQDQGLGRQRGAGQPGAVIGVLVVAMAVVWLGVAKLRSFECCWPWCRR